MKSPFTSPYSPIGIDAGWREVRAVQLVRGRKGQRIHAAACIGRSTAGADLTPQEVSRVVAVLRRQGFVGDRAVACVPMGKTLSGVLELPPRSSGAPLDLIARQELARTSKKELGEIEIAWWELPGGQAGAGRAGVTSALALGCAHADATALLDCLELTTDGSRGGREGLDVLALDAAPTALARACAPMVAPAPSLTAILSIGHEAAQMLVLSGSVVVYERTLAEAGLRLLASGIANQLSSDAELTDYVLRTHGCREPAAGEADEAGDARALVAAHADALAAELIASMMYASRRFDTGGGGGVTRALLVGPGAEVPGLPERVGLKAGLETVVARADGLVPAAQTGRAGGLDAALLGPGAVLALGLALHESGGGAS